MTLDRQKLARILALLASNQAGERDAAVLAAGRLLQAAGLRWEGLAQESGGGASSAAQVAALTESLVFWQRRAQAAERQADDLRTSARTWGKRCVAFEREAADLRARLDIAAAENARLRRALGPDAAARAVFDDMPAVRAMQEAAP